MKAVGFTHNLNLRTIALKQSSQNANIFRLVINNYSSNHILNISVVFRHHAALPNTSRTYSLYARFISVRGVYNLIYQLLVAFVNRKNYCNLRSFSTVIFFQILYQYFHFPLASLIDHFNSACRQAHPF